MQGAAAPEPGETVDLGGTGADLPAEPVRENAPVSSPWAPAKRGAGKRFLAVGKPFIAALLEAEGAEVIHISREDALDDSAWAPTFAKLRKAHFNGVVWGLETGSYRPEFRSTERPHGLQRLEPEAKEQVRAANELARRALETAIVGKPRRLAWWVQGPQAPEPVGPRDL